VAILSACETVAQLTGIGAALMVLFVAGQFVDYLKAEVQTWLMALLACLNAMAPQTQPETVNSAATLPAERRSRAPA